MKKIDTLKAAQVKLKESYRSHPKDAAKTLRAGGRIDFDNLSVHLEEPQFFNPAGLHPAGGGDGTFACPVELMLAGLASCAGVTLAAVATSMKLPISSARVIAEGSLDFRGTLAVDRETPVGLTAIQLIFEIDHGGPPESIQKLIELTKRYCVVHRTLDQPVAITTHCVEAGHSGVTGNTKGC